MDCEGILSKLFRKITGNTNEVSPSYPDINTLTYPDTRYSDINAGFPTNGRSMGPAGSSRPGTQAYDEELRANQYQNMPHGPGNSGSLNTANDIRRPLADRKPWPRIQIQQHETFPATDDVAGAVERAWATIEAQSEAESRRRAETHTSMQTEQQRNADRQGWKTVRVFVSSTFTDMHSEREILVKKVFPELREWCEERKFTLIDCDLRWGVPKDSTTRTTISTCLEEIDRCHEDNNNLPFFVSMLSDRYGWIPSDSEVPDDIKLKYNWVPGVSITHMEILHGAYRFKNPHGIFCFRDPSYASGITEDRKEKFVDKSSISQYHLKRLKQKIFNKFPSQVFEYTCKVAGVESSTGREKVNIVGLEEFAERILDFLKDAIEDAYPKHHLSKELTPKQLDEAAHYTAMKTKSDVFVGRQRELALLGWFFEGHPVQEFRRKQLNQENVERFMSYCDRFHVHPTYPPMVCVIGQGGYGKSALLAKLASQLMQKGERVFYHQIGSTARSPKAGNILRRLLEHLDPAVKEIAPETSDSLLEKLKRLFQLAASQQIRFHRAAIIIDGLDELEDWDTPQYLTWLPPRWPPGITCVISCRADSVTCLEKLQSKDCLYLDVGVLDELGARDLIVDYMRKYNKRLDETQMTSLLRHSSSRVPLWTSVACEELRVFGEFSTVSRKIDTLPDDVGQLIKQVTSRLINEDETQKMQKLLRMICLARGGLPEKEIPSLLGDPASSQDAAPMTWATLRRHLKPFIRNLLDRNGARVGFSHQITQKAIEELVLSYEGDVIGTHAYLADYYDKYCFNYAFLVTDMPLHLVKSGQKRRLVQFYRRDGRCLGTPRHTRQQNMASLACNYIVSTVTAKTYDVYLCRNCSIQRGAFNPTSAQAMDLCALCGQTVISKSHAKPGKLCQKHMVYDTLTDWTRCHHCKAIKMIREMEKMYLCQECSGGARMNTCCMLLLD